MYGNGNLIEKYQEQAINTMSGGELIIRLYDEIVKNLKYASVLFSQKNTAAAQKCTRKARDIFNYLTVILKGKSELSDHLSKLYAFMVGQIVLTNATGDPKYIDAILPQVEELRDAWSEAEKKLRSQPGTEPGKK